MITPSNEFWKIFKETPGALSCAESLAIMNISSQSIKGVYIELGTHKGKSALSAIPFLMGGKFYLVDPIFESHDLILYVANNINKLTEIYPRINHTIDFVRKESVPTLNSYAKEMFAYVFVDSGSHGDGLPMQEAKLLEDRMVQGGIIAWHDYKNQFVEVEQAYNYLLSTGKYEEIKIDWQPIFDYVKEHNLEDGNNSWHQYPELPHPPNFVGALKRK